jgi:two-component system, chemotaxis family, CheB/CheR fusion protein
MAELFDIRDSDRGRSLADLTHRLGYERLEDDFEQVLQQLAPVEREVPHEQGRWYSTRLQPYRTSDDRIQGVVMTFIDITERVDAEQKVRGAKELAEKVVDTVRSPMLVLDDELRVQSANGAFLEYFGVEPAKIKGIRAARHSTTAVPASAALLSLCDSNATFERSAVRE